MLKGYKFKKYQPVTPKKVKGTIKCPFCQSKRLISRGCLKLKKETKPKYFCANCNKYTTKPIEVIVTNQEEVVG